MKTPMVKTQEEFQDLNYASESDEEDDYYKD